LSVNETANVNWLVSGNWRSLLTEDSTDDPVFSYQFSGAFTVAIEMIGP
jgi:hypothetical protein